MVRQDVFDKAKHQRRPEGVTGRLSISDGIPENKLVRRFSFDYILFCDIARALDVYDPLDESDPLTQLSIMIDEYMAAPRTEDEPSLGQVRTLLEVWSMRAWAHLSARDAIAARAMTCGASIADTYWFMHDPEDRDTAQSAEETWKELLQHGRMSEAMRRIRSLDSELPPYLSKTLQDGLEAWAIEPELRREHTIRDEQPLELQPGLEKMLYRNLRAQNRYWRALILGERTPESYLTERDREAVNWRTGVTQFASGALIVFVLVGVTWLIASLAFTIVPGWIDSFLTWAQNAPEDPTLPLIQLVVGNLAVLAGLAGAFWVGGRWVFQKWLEMGGRLRTYFTQRAIDGRTIVPWDRPIG